MHEDSALAHRLQQEECKYGNLGNNACAGCLVTKCYCAFGQLQFIYIFFKKLRNDLVLHIN